MSINNEKNIEPVTELGLAFGYSNKRRRFMSNDYSGAGANAGSGINMTFVTNTLSELVWSPLKGPSNVALLPAHRFTSTTTTNDIAIRNDEDFLTMSSLREMKSGCGQTSAGPNKLTKSGASGNDVGNDKIADTIENQLSALSGHGNEKMAVEAFSGSPMEEERKRFEKIESTSENDLERNPQNEALLVPSEIPHKSKMTCETSKAVIRVHTNRAKGKEKALSEGDLNAMTSKNDDSDDNDSHESVESCNSASLFASGKRRRSFKEQALVSGSSKGSKKQMLCSGGRDSSFMNWISNVMKGFSHSAQERTPLPLSIVGPIIENRDDPIDEKNQEPKNIIGFQSMFQSMYCSKPEARVVVGDGSDPDGNNLGKQLVALSDDSDSNSSLGKRQETKSEDDSVPRSLGKTTTTTSSSRFLRHRNDALGSSWITRFSPKTRNADMADEEEGEGEKECPVLPISAMSLNQMNSILPLPTSKPSKATTSVFVRHLDAKKHVAASSRVCDDTTTTTCLCLFCGAKGHILGDCSEVKETERKEIISNLNSFGNVEDFPSCLCIKCFEHDHWAVSCPNKVETPFKEMQIDPTNKENSENKKLLRFGNQSAAPLQEKKLCYVASSFVENVRRETRIVPSQLFVTSGERNEDAPRDLFDVVRQLRLSRSDIMKWTDSQMSLSQIEGLFLRLRLGKWEEGLGGTGYHVACIIGTQKDDKQKGSKSSLLVKVGGMKCVVESRYISNNDFLEFCAVKIRIYGDKSTISWNIQKLEDELMAWWCISSRTGDKIPAEEDLRLKVKIKNKLGF